MTSPERDNDLIASHVGEPDPEREKELIHRLAGGPTAYLTPWQRVERVALYLLIVAAVVGGVILFTVRQTANGTEASLRLFCPAWRDVATLPLSTTTSPLGIGLIGDARIAYEGANCSSTRTGQLPAPDPRVQQYLQAKGH